MRTSHNPISMGVIVAIVVAATIGAHNPTDERPAIGQHAFTASTTMHVGVLQVQRFGSGEPALILIPGLAGGSWEWDDAIRWFSPTHAIYAVTLPGFDGTKPVAAPLLDKVDASLVQIIKSEHLVRPVIIGHSLGGFIAFRFAEKHSDTVRGIVSVDGLPVFPPVSQMGADERAAAAHKAAASLRTLTAEQFAKQQQTAIASMVSDSVRAAQVARLTAKSDPVATADFLEEDMKSDLRPTLNKDTVPTLVLAPVPSKAGPEYPPFMQTMTPKELSAAVVQFYEGLVTGAPHVTVKPIANSLHYATIDQPQAVNDAIAYFLKGTTPMSLTSAKWRLVGFGDKESVPTRAATLQFDATHAFGSGGCNQFSGSYRTSDSKLTFSQVVSTLMACTSGMEAEAKFFKVLERAAAYKIASNELSLYDKDGKTLARLRASE